MFKGTYNWRDQLVLELNDPASDDTISGTFTNHNFGWSCPVTGGIVPWDGHHPRVLISLWGRYRRDPQPSEPQVFLHSMISVYGYAENLSSTDPIQQFQLVQGWSEDNANHGEWAGSQPLYPFDRVS